MHTAESITALSDKEARQLLEDLATQLFKTQRFKKAMAEQIGMTGDGVNNWFRADGRPPVLAILWLEAMLRAQKADEIVANFRAITQAVNDYPA